MAFLAIILSVFLVACSGYEEDYLNLGTVEQEFVTPTGGANVVPDNFSIRVKLMQSGFPVGSVPVFNWTLQADAQLSAIQVGVPNNQKMRIVDGTGYNEADVYIYPDTRVLPSSGGSNVWPHSAYFDIECFNTTTSFSSFDPSRRKRRFCNLYINVEAMNFKSAVSGHPKYELGTAAMCRAVWFTLANYTTTFGSESYNCGSEAASSYNLGTTTFDLDVLSLPVNEMWHVSNLVRTNFPSIINATEL